MNDGPLLNRSSSIGMLFETSARRGWVFDQENSFLSSVIEPRFYRLIIKLVCTRSETGCQLELGDNYWEKLPKKFFNLVISSGEISINFTPHR